MKSQFLTIAIALACVPLFSACSPQDAATVPAPASTLAPSAEPAPPASTIPAPTPVPAVATITFETDSCSYDGPQTLPASETLTVTWRIKTTVGDVYALSPFITDETKSREDLVQALQGLDIHRPALPAGLTSAGTSLTLARGSLNVSVKTASGPLHGLLYFSCWAAGEAYDVLGPIELK